MFKLKIFFFKFSIEISCIIINLIFSFIVTISLTDDFLKSKNFNVEFAMIALPIALTFALIRSIKIFKSTNMIDHKTNYLILNFIDDILAKRNDDTDVKPIKINEVKEIDKKKKSKKKKNKKK